METSYEVDRLVERIKNYSKSYYEGNPEISKKGIGKGKVLPIDAKDVEE